MCILCVIQKWSRRVATMLPWLVIPLIGLWALSQLLPPAFRFEITSPRLACVFVLLVTLFWYEILMPQLSAWRVRRSARFREMKRFEAVEMHKLRKTATRRCRNCLTPYRDQNPVGGRFMCSYCGHVSKRPALDLPVSPGSGISSSGILKDLVGLSGKILSGKAWSDNGWVCGQDWLDSGSWVAGSLGNGVVFFGSNDHCSEKSYSRVGILACKVLTDFLLCILWVWRKIFRVSSSSDDGSVDADHRGMLAKRGEDGTNCPESRGEKARRKAEEKRQARLEKEQLEEEERKQREEVARLVEERRRLRDEKTKAEKDRGKGSPPVREKNIKKEAEKKRQERKKEKDRGSSKSNSDAEELERRTGKEGEQNRKSETDRWERQRTVAESVKYYSTEIGHGFKGTTTDNYTQGNVGTRYLDRMRGTFLSSSRALAGGSFYGKSANVSGSVSREHKFNGSVDHAQTSAVRRELSQPERVSAKPDINGDDKNINQLMFVEPEPNAASKKSWQQLFTRSSAVAPPSNSNVISCPSVKTEAEVQSPSFPSCEQSTQPYDNPINFGLPSPFDLSAFHYGSMSSSAGLSSSSESIFPRIGEAPCKVLSKESKIFEDPSYVPDLALLLGPISESLDNFQLDLGFVSDKGLEKPRPLKNIPSSSEVSKPSPIESPLSRLRVSDERHGSSFLFPATSIAQDMRTLLADDSSNANENGMWQMWNTSPLGQDGLGLVGGAGSWLLSPELNRLNKEGIMPHKTMASLFKKDEQLLSGLHSPKKGFLGQNSGMYSASVPSTTDDPWLPRSFFGPMTGSENHFPLSTQQKTTQNEMIYGSPSGSATNQPFELSPANSWVKKEHIAVGEGIGNPSTTKPPIGGLYSTPNVQSLWSYD